MPERKLELPEGVPPLNTYYVYLTAGCNLACQHCWLSPKFQRDGGTGGHLDYGLLTCAIDEGLPLGLSSIKLTGGEPLLHPDFIQIVNFIRERNLSLGIETNGVLLTRDLALYLKNNSSLKHISVSVDSSDAEKHDRFRGVKGSFEKAVNAVQYLSEMGYHPQVIMSVHSGNIDEIESLVFLAKDIGAASVKFNIIQPTGRGELLLKRDGEIALADIIEKGQWIESDLQKRSSIPLYYSWPMAFYSLKRLTAGNNGTCAIHNILGILPSGELSMCGIGTHIPDLCYGKIGDVKIADVWTSHSVIKKMRQTLPAELDGVCSRCLLKERCLGNCVAENYYLSGRLNASYWFCQDALEQGLFPLSRLD